MTFTSKVAPVFYFNKVKHQVIILYSEQFYPKIDFLGTPPPHTVYVCKD